MADMFDDKEKLKGDVKIPVKQLLRRTLAYVKPEIRGFIISGLLILINVGLDVSVPYLMKSVTENLSSDHIDLKYIISIAVLMLVITVINNVFLYIESMVLQRSGQNIILNLRTDVFTHIEEMSQNQFTEMPVGSLVTRVTNYTQSMSDLFTNVIVNVIRNVVTIV